MNTTLLLRVQKNRSKFLTFSVVGGMHLLCLYLIWHSEMSNRSTTPSSANAIQVKFVSLKKSVNTPLTQTKETLNHQNEQRQKQVQSQKTEVYEKAKHEIIHTSTSQKKSVSAKHQEQFGEKKNTVNSNDNLSNQLLQDVQDPQQQSNVSNGQVSSNSDDSPQSQSTETLVKGVGEDARQQNDIQPTTNKMPIPVSKVDVLRLGKFNYDDRELKNQQRVLILTIHINAEGLAVNITIKQSSGVTSLDERAIKAMKKTKFKPHQINGEAVSVIVDFPIQLKMSRNR